MTAESWIGATLRIHALLRADDDIRNEAEACQVYTFTLSTGGRSRMYKCVNSAPLRKTIIESPQNAGEIYELTVFETEDFGVPAELVVGWISDDLGLNWIEVDVRNGLAKVVLRIGAR